MKNGIYRHDKLPDYDLIYADPPWPKRKGGKRKCRPNQSRTLDYPVMTLEQIEECLGGFAAQAAPCHNFFVWTIDEFLHDCEAMMVRLGYRLHARIVWDKTNGVAPAFTVRFTHEYLLWFYPPGRMLKPDTAVRGRFPTVIREPSTTHSTKPQAAYRMLEALFPGARRLELFARHREPGWECWGNEVESDRTLF